MAVRQLLTNCSVLPCDGRPAIPDAAILLDGNRIEAVDRADALAPLTRNADPSLRVRDMGGRWVMPGMLDMHVHLGLALPGPAQMAAKLETDMALLVTAGLFVSGLATLLQTLGIGPIGSRLPIVQGISFVSVST